MHEHLRIPDDEALRIVISDVLGISADKVRPEAALVADLHATSLDFLEIVVGVEDAFHIEIDEREASQTGPCRRFRSADLPTPGRKGEESDPSSYPRDSRPLIDRGAPRIFTCDGAPSRTRMAMNVVIEFFRIREADDAHAIVGREIADATDR